MKHVILMISLAFMAAGCSSFSEYSTDVPKYANVEGDEKAIATYVVANISYQLFHFIPFSTGITWKGEDEIDSHNVSNFTLFDDQATLDENLASVKAATRLAGSNRISNLLTTIDHSSAWSLFLVRRRMIKTTCLILERKQD